MMAIVKKVFRSKFAERLRRKIALNTGIFCKVKRLSASASEDLRTVKILKTFNFTKVLDIGANTGQFAESLYDFGYKSKVVSFEPTQKVYDILFKRAKKYKNWEIAEKMAIGNNCGFIEINVSSDSLFSSIKNISQTYTDYNKSSKAITQEKVKINSIDSLENIYFSKDENIFLKIDTQGYEKEVLEGAERSLGFVNGIKIEIPLVPIYDKIEWGLLEIVSFLNQRGFTCVSLNEVAVNNATGLVHEVDGIFIKSILLNKINK